MKQNSVWLGNQVTRMGMDKYRMPVPDYATVVRSLVGKPEPNKLYRAEILSLRTNISGNIFDSVVSFILDMFS